MKKIILILTIMPSLLYAGGSQNESLKRPFCEAEEKSQDASMSIPTKFTCFSTPTKSNLDEQEPVNLFKKKVQNFAEEVAEIAKLIGERSEIFASDPLLTEALASLHLLQERAEYLDKSLNLIVKKEELLEGSKNYKEANFEYQLQKKRDQLTIILMRALRVPFVKEIIKDLRTRIKHMIDLNILYSAENTNAIFGDFNYAKQTFIEIRNTFNQIMIPDVEIKKDLKNTLDALQTELEVLGTIYNNGLPEDSEELSEENSI